MKNLKTTALASFVVLALSSISSVSAADGTINFTGEITDAGCNTSVNGSSATTGDVDMGKVVKLPLKALVQLLTVLQAALASPSKWMTARLP